MKKLALLLSLLAAGPAWADAFSSAPPPSVLLTGANTWSGAQAHGANAVTGSNFGITGGAVDGTPIGATTPSTGAFSTLNTTSTTNLATGGPAHVNITGNATWTTIAAKGSTNAALVLSGSGTGYVQVYQSPLQLSPPTLWSSSVTPYNQGFAQNSNYSGTSSSTTFFNQILIGDHVTSPASSSALYIEQDVGTGSKTHGAITLNVKADLQSTTGNATGSDYTGIQAWANAEANDNGTSSSYAGGVYGLNSVATLASGATYFGSVVSLEADVFAAAGSSVANKIGIQIVQEGGDTVSGSIDDVALTINNQFAQGSGAGWKYGIQFGRTGGNFPMKTTGTLITGATTGGNTVANGIDWSMLNFTGNPWNDGKTILTASGQLAMSKMTASGSAPGAGKMRFEVAAGTNAGTCKLIAYAGTSTTPSTVADNVGSGC